jgi:hypothetical protein
LKIRAFHIQISGKMEDLATVGFLPNNNNLKRIVAATWSFGLGEVSRSRVKT